jgi:5-methylcytosine-specific restriction endonuclease McrA
VKRTSIKRRKSERLKEYDAEFEIARAKAMFVYRGMCQASVFTFDYRRERGLLWTVCGDGYEYHSHHADHVHHRKYRSRGGTNADANLLPVCQAAHDWIHANGGFGQPANLLGLALSAGESEEL